MQGAILVLNCGSSSIKYAVYDGLDEAPPLRGDVPDIDAASGHSHKDSLDHLLHQMQREQPDVYGRIKAVGHRVVHGGIAHDRSVVLTPAIIADLEALSPLAPQHQPHNLAGIRAVAAHWPDIPQVACFDTAFHRGNSMEAQSFALPREMTASGIRRYGFHGLSYDHISEAMGAHLEGGERRVVAAHLGHGASLCAMLDGKSVATTMGFTALDGLMMATRCGSLDPGVILYLMQEKGMSAEAVNRLLYDRSGLLGVSGISGDMRQLLASDAPEARQAIDLYTYRIARETGSLMAALGGLDAIIFTGGVGENAVAIRADVCLRLEWAGLSIDEAANAAGKTRFSAPGSRVTALVIPADEELVIARDVAALA